MGFQSGHYPGHLDGEGRRGQHAYLLFQRDGGGQHAADARLPADPGVGPQREFGSVLGSTWRIVAASIVAQLLAELADTEVYHRYVVRFGTRRQFGRVLASNAVSIPLDSVLFTVIAFAGVFPSSTVTQIIVANVVVKGLASFLAWPMIYAVPEVDSTLA